MEQKTITINTVADFKRELQLGRKVVGIRHTKIVGRDDEKKVIYADEELAIREVSIKQTNRFALKTTRTNGEIVDSWCDYPKAKESKVENNRITIFEKDLRQSKGGCMMEGNPEYDCLPMIPVLTYWIISE